MKVVTNYGVTHNNVVSVTRDKNNKMLVNQILPNADGKIFVQVHPIEQDCIVSIESDIRVEKQ